MKAMLSKVPGGPETLVIEEIAEPVPGPGQLLVRVAAVGANFPDSLIISDRYQFRPARPFSPGGELSGTVEAVGDGVTGFVPGDRVLAMTIWGALAEKVTVDAWRCACIPDDMPFDEAAAFLLTYGTSYHALVDRAHLKAGETLLVLGAAGGVGLAAVEIGKALGARVVAAASSRQKVELAQRLGADEVVVYDPRLAEGEGQRVLAAEFKKACGAQGADVIMDPVGGAYSEPALRSIAWLGRLLVVGFPAGIAKIPLNLPLLKGCDVLGIFWGSAMERDAVRHREALAELFGLYSQGAVKPVISARYPFERGADAIIELSARRASGKIVVTVP
ncbi:MAG: NADPH:quinone oxidoreductase family protein [Rhizobiaceae bacterium]|nr:NADPH:quinone oxidoreductase family protein [Rhizobiaceae bacterium]